MDTGTCTVNSYSASAVSLCGRALHCLVLRVHRQGEWTTKSIQLLSHLSSLWISGGDCLGTYKQCLERGWSQSGPLSSPPGAAAHTRYVPSSPVSQGSCHTDLHTSVCVPSSHSHTQKSQRPCPQCPEQNIHVCTTCTPT